MSDQDEDEKGKAEKIKGYLDDAIRSAQNYDRTELSDKRAKALEYYFGIMDDVPSLEGRSRVVSRDVAVVIGWMLPGIIRTFTQSGRIVDFEPATMEDEETSDQASDYINHKFLKQNDGYRIMYSAIHDALLNGNGIIKCWWDDTPEYKTTIHTGLSEDQLALLLQDDDVEVLTQDEYLEAIQDPTGQVPATEEVRFDVKIRRLTKSGDLKMVAIEPENFLMDKESTTIPESRFVAQRDTVTKSDLVEMGFDRDLIDMLPTDGTQTYMSEEIVREDDRINITDVSEESTQLVEIFECYIKMDIDDDGVAETIKAYYAGNHGAGELLDWEVWEDEYPFVDIPCEPVPHRFDAMSIADQTMDLQRIKTVLSRAMLDNTYANNNPQPQIEEGAVVNTDSINSPKFGQPIIRRRGSRPIEYNTTPFIADKTLAALNQVDQEIERRTGISRNTMALDPDTLQNQTATAVNAQKDASYSKVELVARNMAELGFRMLFRLALRLVVKHQDRAEMIRLRGTWVPMDPRSWNADMDCTVNTGLGTGSRERDVAALNNMLGLQMNFRERLQSQNLVDQGIEMIPKVVKTATKIGESSGLKNAEDYFPNVSPESLQAIRQTLQQKMQEPNPEVQKAQAEMQMEQQRMQMEQQQKQVEFQGKMAIEEKKIEQHVVREREQLNADVQTKQLEAQLNAEFQAKELEARREKELRDHQIDVAKIQLAERELEWKMGESEAKMNLDAAKTTDQLDVQLDIAEMQNETQRRNNEQQVQERASEQSGGPSSE